MQTLLALAGGIALFFIFCLILVFGSQIAYARQIYPGVSVAGIDLSGLTESQAVALLAQQMTFPQTGKIFFRDGERTWLRRPTDLGLMVDALPNAQAAYALGRSGALDPQAGVAQRAPYIVDPDGVLRFVYVTDLSVGRSPDEVLRVLDALQSGEVCPCNWQKGEDTLEAAWSAGRRSRPRAAGCVLIYSGDARPIHETVSRRRRSS